MRKIVITLSKGGIAKTTTAVTLAHGLALAKRKTLLIDTDDQGQSGFLLGVDPKEGLAQVISEDKGPTDVALEARKNLWLLKGGSSLSAVKREIGRKDFGAEQTLAEKLNCIEKKFDYVIIDTSPSWDSLTINALFYAQEILTPVSLEALTLNSLISYSNRLNTVQRYNKKLTHKYVLPTFFDRRVKKSNEILNQLKVHFKSILCKPIRYNVKLSESAGFGQTIFEHASNSPGAEDYKQLIKRIIKDE